MVYKYSGGRTAKEARWMIYGFCLCTTVLTVVSCWATGCGVRLIHSRYMKNNDWKEIQWRIGHSNIQLTTWIIFILQMFLLFNWSWKSVTEKITKFFFSPKKRFIVQQIHSSLFFGHLSWLISLLAVAWWLSFAGEFYSQMFPTPCLSSWEAF